VLSGGILGRKLMRFPFHRDIQLTAAGVEVMTEHARYCQREGGVAVVTPESRCSLHLKGYELCEQTDGEETRETLREFEDLPWRDVIDESDEVLRYQFQLVYAVGEVKQLPALAERYSAGRLVTRTLIECCDAIGAGSINQLPTLSMKTLARDLEQTNFPIKALNFRCAQTDPKPQARPESGADIEKEKKEKQNRTAAVADAVLDRISADPHNDFHDFKNLHRYCQRSPAHRQQCSPSSPTARGKGRRSCPPTRSTTACRSTSCCRCAPSSPTACWSTA
jgi:hypothetical protein